MYRAIRINLQSNSQLKQISRTAGRVYSKTVSLIRKTHEKKDFWLSCGAVKKYLKLKDYPIHSQTTQALIEGYFDALKSYFKLYKNDNENACPPYKTPKYHSVPFKQSAIKVEDVRSSPTPGAFAGLTGKIRLSLGKGREPLILDLPKTPKCYIRTAEICWDKTQRIYYLVLTIKWKPRLKSGILVKKSRYKKAKAIDLGEIHPLVATDGKKTVIYNFPSWEGLGVGLNP